MSESILFDDLFKKCTTRIKGDGNCFITSAMKIHSKTFREARYFRRALYDAAVNHFGQEFVDNNPDYCSLKKNRVWVEWSAGASALSLLIGEPVVIVSEKGSIKAENGNVEILEPDKRNEAIMNGVNTIVYNRNHYQPLSENKREQFVLGITVLDNARNNSQEQIIFNDPIESREQILFDAIDNAFTGNNRVQARNTVNEILANVADEEKENMLTILLGGIIAEHEHEEKKNKESVLLKANKAKAKAAQVNKEIKSEPSHSLYEVESK